MKRITTRTACSPRLQLDPINDVPLHSVKVSQNTSSAQQVLPICAIEGVMERDPPL